MIKTQLSKYKLCRSLGCNIRKNFKFLHFCLSRQDSNKWKLFIQSCVLPTEDTPRPIKTSFLYKAKVLQKKKERVFFGLKKSKLASRNLYSSLSFLLFSARFFPTLQSARRAVRSGCVFVNGDLVTFPEFSVEPGASVYCANVYKAALIKTSFFSIKGPYTVVAQVPYFLEVSFSSGTFVFCFFTK